MGQDAVPAASLASWTREAGGHRPSPLRGGADSSAATTQVNDGKTVGTNGTETLHSEGVGNVPVYDRPVLQPQVPRWHADRRCVVAVLLAIQQDGLRQVHLFAPCGVPLPLMFSRGKLLTPRTPQAPRDGDDASAG